MNTKIPLFRIENSGICFWNIQKLLFPVVPDVLDIVVIFHGVDELLHPKPSVSWEKREEIKENGDEIICKIKLHVNK